MPSPERPLPRGRSAFAAAFLSLLFPGLGHAYGGAYARALAWAAPAILAIALVAGLLTRMNQYELLGYAAANLGFIFVVNVILLVYRAAAILDAWRVVSYVNAFEASGGGRLGRPRVPVRPIPVAGLLGVLLVMSAAHVAVAQYDLKLSSLVGCVFDDTGTANCGDDGAGADPGASPTAGSTSEPTIAPTVIGSVGTDLPSATATPPPDLTKRFNILLIGSDQRPRDNTYNTDTMIVVSVDPQSHQVAMFSLPRDMVDIPLPPGPAQAVFGSAYRGKINGFLRDNLGRSDLWPGAKKRTGYTALKAILGNLYGIDIRYYVEVNFTGFKQVVDALGGVSINVQVPVVDDDYPIGGGNKGRVYIPAGYQHMDGSEALIYARSRHGSNDFDRAARQQKVLISLRAQVDPATMLPKLDELIGALENAVQTDIPAGLLPQLLNVASGVDTKEVRSFVFAPPLYGSDAGWQSDPRGYRIEPNIQRIRKAVAGAFTSDPAAEAQREALAEEHARVWILNGSGISGQAGSIAAYLQTQGVDASSPTGSASRRPKRTKIVVYNGAETKDPATVAYLAKLFGVTPTTATDPTVLVDIIVTTARSTPTFTPPPGG
ncbi:MAG TPA: LCP family protein [Candidatus Limnocylindrales bacterium]|nr:LCP family protein [Candidatus Limnocylindrales bacterium]